MAVPCQTIDVDLLDHIQQRVLWLSTYLIHYANNVRPNPDGTKVGGHQASCASVVTMLTAYYFATAEPGDLIAIKPHASPVYHVIQYLLGNLPLEKLRQFRSFGGLQAYPSRSKDPDGVQISTGSVGFGAVMPNSVIRATASVVPPLAAAIRPLAASPPPRSAVSLLAVTTGHPTRSFACFTFAEVFASTARCPRRSDCVAASGSCAENSRSVQALTVRMIDSLFNLLFRCQHRRLTRPFVDGAARSYTACLDCGAHFEYDACDLRQGKRLGQPAPAPSFATPSAARS